VAAADAILLRGPPPPVRVVYATYDNIYHYHDYRYYYYYCVREYRMDFFFKFHLMSLARLSATLPSRDLRSGPHAAGGQVTARGSCCTRQ